MYYRECELCGAALDPNERCDCTADKSEDKEKDTAGYCIGEIKNALQGRNLIKRFV